jgi:hypothetical protein
MGELGQSHFHQLNFVFIFTRKIGPHQKVVNLKIRKVRVSIEMVIFGNFLLVSVR